MKITGFKKHLAFALLLSALILSMASCNSSNQAANANVSSETSTASSQTSDSSSSSASSEASSNTSSAAVSSSAASQAAADTNDGAATSSSASTYGTANTSHQASSSSSGSHSTVTKKSSSSTHTSSHSSTASHSSSSKPSSSSTSSTPTPVEANDPIINGGFTINRKPIGSFIQSWAVQGWDEQRWDEEFAAMKEAGFQFIILQSVVDVGYSKDADQDKYGEDYSKYSVTSVDTLYPSDIALLKNKNGGVDTLGNCFKSAKKNGMKVMLAPLNDDRWWIYGWNTPKADTGVTDLVNDSYFGKWAKENAEFSNQIANEIWSKYGAQYSDVFYGWYYYNEIWNMTPICKGTDKDGIITKILANNFNILLDNYSKITPGKPFLFSPYCNFSMSTAAEYGDMWKGLFKLVNFRSGDIFCPQDSIGGNPDQLANLATWTKAYKDAADSKPGLKYWSNNEDFTDNYGTAMLDRYFKQVNITSQYAEQNIVFSWNHYLNTLLKTDVNEGFNTTYLDAIKNGKLDGTAPNAPKLSKSGKTVTISRPTDNNAVAGYYIYTSNGSLYQNIKTDEDVDSETVTLTKGTYYVRAYDFADNQSAKSTITIS